MSTTSPQFFPNAHNTTVDNLMIQNVQGDYHQHNGGKRSMLSTPQVFPLTAPIQILRVIVSFYDYLHDGSLISL
jgi:hypothetical protein